MKKRRRKGTRRRLNGIAAVLAGASAIAIAPQLATTSLEAVPSAVVDAPANAAAALVDASTRAMATTAANVTGKHLGFDTYAYPGDRTMARWKESSPYEWVGYYLPAPCHGGNTWVGKRERLQEMGWGMAVIYVGQQTWDGHKQPSAAQVARARRDGTLECHKSLLTGPQGDHEARDAIARTASEGFARGSVIFLDVEYMDQTPASMRRYVRAWTERVITDGRYRPGVYVHTRNAQVIYDEVKAIYARHGVTEEPPFWIAGGGRFDTKKVPTDVGHRFAGVWQGILDVHRTHAGIKLYIDVNVAAVPSPSSHEYAWPATQVASSAASSTARGD